MLAYITVEDIEFDVYYSLENGEPATLGLPPEDCDEGTTAELIILAIHFNEATFVSPDLIPVLKEEVITEIETKIMENR